MHWKQRKKRPLPALWSDRPEISLETLSTVAPARGSRVARRDAATPGETERDESSGQTFRRVGSLLRLVDDESLSVARAAYEQLIGTGAVALRAVRRVAEEEDDARLRVRAREVEGDLSVLDEWMECVSRGELDLESGVVLISRTEYPQATSYSVKRALDRLADQLRARLASCRTMEAAVAALRRLLVDRHGFGAGEPETIGAHSSCIHHVLAAKHGLPIALSTIWLLVARRVDLGLFGVGLPERFILGYPIDRATVGFIDPFSGGTRMTLADCKEFLARRGIAFRSSWLRPVTDQEILRRSLANLERCLAGLGDELGAIRVRAMMRVLPAPPVVTRDPV